MTKHTVDADTAATSPNGHLEDIMTQSFGEIESAVAPLRKEIVAASARNGANLASGRFSCLFQVFCPVSKA
jgi:hypothetical protein